MKTIVLAALLVLSATGPVFAAAPAKINTPKPGMIKVAFVISEGADVMTSPGSWEVFQDTHARATRTATTSCRSSCSPSAPAKAPLHTTGSNHPGLTITPDYSFADAADAGPRRRRRAIRRCRP